MSGLEDDFFAACPRRLLEWSESKDGRVVVLRPRFGSSRLGRVMATWLGAGHYRIRLDPMGTLAWKSFDGKTSLHETLHLLRGEFGERIEPAEDRLRHFVMQMIRSRLIELYLPDGQNHSNC